MALISLVSHSSRGDGEQKLSLSDWAKSNDFAIKGEVNCRISDQFIMEVKDGKSIRFSSAKGQPKVGDYLTFEYGSSLPGHAFEVKLKYPSGAYFEEEIQPLKGSSSRPYVKFENDFHWSAAHLMLHADNLIWRSSNPLFSGSLSLKRYYKSDWDGIYTEAFHSGDFRFTKDALTIQPPVIRKVTVLYLFAHRLTP